MINSILLPITIAILAINCLIGIVKTDTVGARLFIFIVFMAATPPYIKLTIYFFKKFDKKIRKHYFLIRWVLICLLCLLTGLIVFTLICLTYLIFIPFAFILINEYHIVVC